MQLNVCISTHMGYEMKTIGIIAEFNPFHNGHEYLIREAKRLTQANFVVVVMSGNFVQRGAPALLDKYTRTRMALENDVDLVIELPALYATASAEYFSRAAVRLLDKLSVVDYLCFGSECGDIELLQKAATALSNEDENFQKQLQENIKMGMTFPQARSKAVDSTSQFVTDTQSTKNLDKTCFDSDIQNIINQPNNILGIEYIKALKHFSSNIVPITIKRQGCSYHEEQAASASAIRRVIEELVKGTSDSSEEVREFEPLASQADVDPEMTEKLKVLLNCRFISDFSELLYYKLLLHSDSGYSRFFDVSNDLSDKIKKNLGKYTNYEDFIRILKSKDLTYMRISRCLNHILLDIYDDEISTFIDNDYVFYARMLGFRDKAGDLLKKIKEQSSIPLLSKLADADQLLDDIGMRMLKKDIQVAHIYGRRINEYTAQIVKL